MPGFKISYCERCRKTSAHDIYISEGGYLHSLCTDCGKDCSSGAQYDNINGDAEKYCDSCRINTSHIRYISTGGYIHWFCCSCGKDISSDSRV
jgi:hypothetical protein